MKPELEGSSGALEDGPDQGVFVPTAELASVGRAIPDPVVLGDALAHGAMDAFGVEKPDDELKNRGVVGEVPIELVEGVAALGCGASLGGALRSLLLIPPLY